MANSIMFCHLLFIFILAFAPAAASLSLSNETDLVSLLAIKSVLQDPLGSLTSWNQSTHFCNWTGIRCGRKHPDRVVGIELRSQGLAGSLSPHVGNLSFLRLIILKNNTFNGPIPQEISLLRRLEFVEFSNNSFTGAIPKNLSRSLVFLNLIDNQLSGIIPTELGRLMFKLKDLGLGRNILSGPIPPSIGNLTSLRQLYLASSGLKGEIPASFAQLPRLRSLQLAENGLTGTIPSGLFNLSAIQHLNLFDNQLYGVVPSTIGLTLPNLVFLHLAKNQLNGPIPASMSNASLLQYLLLGNNYFTGQIPTTLGRLTHLRNVILLVNQIEDDIKFISSFINSTNLEVLQVDKNLLTGSLPNSIANLSTQLSWLTLRDNKVHGRIPSAIGNLISLTVIDLSYNYLETPIPVSIAKLSNLHIFDATANRFADDLPSSFGNLTSLLYLLLDENKFSGNLPPSIGNCTNLLDLDISRNTLRGLIPPEIMSISSLSIGLRLSNNLFEGPIPNEVGSLRNLVELDLSYNRLSGPIQDSLSTCSSLQVLDMTGNLLEGEIPLSLSALAGLEYLNLSQNNLSGPIPTFLAKLDLRYVNLSFNRLQGEVPVTGIFKNKTSFSLDGNKELCGGISELKLPPCPAARSQKKSLSTLLKIMIPIFAAGGIFVTVWATFLYKQRMSRKNVTPSLSSFTGVQIMRLSYADILKATGGFSETNLLGFGRFGSVYKGILDDRHTEIAVKVLNLSVRGASRTLVAECSALRNVRHRNLLKILSVCESIDFQGNDFKALVYEFKANGSLDKWLHQGEQNAESNNLTMMQRLNIAVDIAEGIEYLHSGTDSCIVHGDLKPSNILLDRDMTASIGDFGLSKFISDIIPSNESNSSIGIRGTIGYVPPEYGMSCSVSVQGDAYSYGIVLLEMFTNKRPTDLSFEDHVNLHCFVSAALRDRVMEVVDSRFQAHMNNDKIKDCLASVLNIGVSCSKEIPRERMSMTNVVNELHKIQKLLTRTR